MFLGLSHAYVDATVIVSLSIVASLIVLWTVRNIVSHEQLTPHNEVSGFVYAAVGVIYAVVLGFAVISVWEEYRDSQSDASQEANAAANVYRIASGLPEPSRSAIQQSSLDYVSSVIDDDWPAMEHSEDGSPATFARLNELWNEFYAADINSPRDAELYSEGLDQLHLVSSYRRERLVASDDGLLGIMWGVLIAGAVLTILFPCLFGVENGLVHSLIISTLAATLGLLLFLAYDLNHPFRGDVHVQPVTFQEVLTDFTSPAPSLQPAGSQGLFRVMN